MAWVQNNLVKSKTKELTMQNFNSVKKIDLKIAETLDTALRNAVMNALTEMSNKGHNTRELLAVSFEKTTYKQQQAA